MYLTDCETRFDLCQKHCYDMSFKENTELKVLQFKPASGQSTETVDSDSIPGRVNQNYKNLPTLL